MKKRIYIGSDAYLLEQCEILKRLLKENLPDFKKFDATFNNSYIKNWEKNLKAAITIGSDNEYILQNTDNKMLLQQLMLESSNFWRTVKFFAQKAFQQQPEILHAFGSKEYTQASKKPKNMVAFLENLIPALNLYKKQLVQAGWSASGIAKINQLLADLEWTVIELAKHKRNRNINSTERVDKLNACYSFCKHVCTAAQIIYADDNARKSMYVYSSKLKTSRAISKGLKKMQEPNIEKENSTDREI